MNFKELKELNKVQKELDALRDKKNKILSDADKAVAEIEKERVALRVYRKNLMEVLAR